MSAPEVDTHHPGWKTVSDRVWERLERFVAITARAMVWAAIAALVVLMIHVIADVGMRYFFNRPLRATIDWVSFWWMILLGFFGFVAAAKRRDHIDVTLYTDRLSRRNELLLLQIVHVLTAAFLLAIVWFGWENAMEQFAKRESTGATRIAIWPMRFVVPAACAVFVLQLLVDLRNLGRSRSQAEPGTEE